MMEFEGLKVIIGQTVRYQRISKGWTQSQLAASSGLKRTTISNIEAGRQSVTIEQFSLIMSLLDVKPADVLSTALQRLTSEERWSTVESVVNASKVKEDVVRKYILDTLK